jgi:K+-sensing histidine kinase KdpD
VVVDAPAASIAVDAPKVERIVENLVVNAARHTAAGTTIWVGVQPHDGGVLLLVEDEGPGVPAELREQIFQPFRKGRNVADHAPGSGIGPALVTRFASLHGGRLPGLPTPPPAPRRHRRLSLPMVTAVGVGLAAPSAPEQHPQVPMASRS